MFLPGKDACEPAQAPSTRPTPPQRGNGASQHRRGSGARGRLPPFSIPEKHHPPALLERLRAGPGTRAQAVAPRLPRPRRTRPNPSTPHGTAGKREAGPGCSPHDDPLALDVHLVESELVGERHVCSKDYPTTHATLFRCRLRSTAATAASAGAQLAPPLPVSDWPALPAAHHYWLIRLPVSGQPAPAGGPAETGGPVTSRTQPAQPVAAWRGVTSAAVRGVSAAASSARAREPVRSSPKLKYV